MAVSLDIYRQSIGLYQLSGTQKMKSLKRKSFSKAMNPRQFQNYRKTKISDIFLCCGFYLALFLLLNCSILNETNVNKNVLENSSCRNTSIPHGWKVLDVLNVPPVFIISWGASLDTNLLCHIMFGNGRRNIGYKYFTWNCDRGLITRNKLEDIKCFAPHTSLILWESWKLICKEMKTIKMNKVQTPFQLIKYMKSLRLRVIR